MALPRMGRNLIERPRLSAALAARTPLTIVRAPSGFGKTTLVLQALSQALSQSAGSGETVAWVRVRRDTTDAASFWLNVVDALTDAGLAAPTLTGQRPPFAVAERMLSAAKDTPVLVVDGLHEVTDESVDQQLVELLWDVPELRLIICLRSHRRFLRTLSVDLEITSISACDLLFTAAETEELFERLGVDLETAEVRLAQEETGGWPEPVKRLAHRLRATPEPRDVSPIADAVMSDYLHRRLAHEVTSPELLQFALVTALPAEFTAELAEYLSGDVSAKTHLACLEREGMLLASEATDGAEIVYRWPGAARKAMLRELRKRRTDDFPVLQARLAEWYLRNDRPALAIEHATRAQDWSIVEQIVDTAWLSLITHHPDRLYEAFLGTPLEALAGNPRALAVRDICLTGADRLLQLPRLPADDEGLAELGRRADVYDVLDTGLATIVALRRRGEFQLARSQADALQAIAATARAARPSDVYQLLPVLELHIGLTRLLADDVAGTYAPLRRAYARASDSPHDHVQADAASGLALVHALNGEVPESSTWLRRHSTARRPTGSFAPYIRAKANAARMLTALDQVDLDEADAAAEEMTRDPAGSEFWAFTVYAHAQHALHTGAISDALGNLDRARTAHPAWWAEGAAAAALTSAAEADLLTALGRANQARAVLSGASSDHPFLRVAQARLELSSGRPSVALQLGRDSTWTRAATARHRLEMLVIKAVASYRLGDLPDAVNTVRRAIGESRALGAIRPFLLVPRADLVAIGGHHPRLVDVLDAPSLRNHPDVFPAELALVRLTEREQRVLEKLAGGMTLQQVADALVVSYNTVKTQQRSLYRKLGVEARADAIARARQWGLL
jgi:LuxR family transcriptional regulator, maltose regulon positive regulatory protein